MMNHMSQLLERRYLLKLGIALACLLLLLSGGVAQAVRNAITIDGNVLAPGDWDDEVCRQDSLGADDVSGQRDLTFQCIASNYATNQPATVIYVRFDLDETSFTGSNSSDVCMTFDTDGDGNVNRALCVTVSGSPATLSSVTLYTCNDTKTENCAGSTATTFTGSCAVQTLSPSNPFSPASAPDTAIECGIPVSNISMGNIVRTNICAYPSGQTNSNPGDCTLASTRLYTNTATGASGETAPTAIALVSFTGAPGSAGLGWYGLAALALLAGALLLWRRRQPKVHALD